MTVSELGRARYVWGRWRPLSVAEVAQRGEEFERMPPHDVAAEQCVLGGMLLSKDAISDVIEVIRPGDHYRPAHQLVHEAILDLYARGEPADPIMVANELTRRGELTRIGGAPYLHTLIASVPTAANAGYYARIVRERAILRRLVEAGTRIVQLGYTGDADADELVDRAQAEVYGVTDRRITEDYHSLSEIMPGALEEIEAIGAHGGGITGVPTGFADLDALTNGLHAGQMVVIAARPAVGKALALDTPLATPTGWTAMGAVRPGDQLLGADGTPTRVIAATEVMHGRPCYQVEFSDGEVIVADDGHQWLTWTSHAAGFTPPQIVTTGEMARALSCRALGTRSRYAVAMPRRLELPEAHLPVTPYALGSALAGRALAGAAGRSNGAFGPSGARSGSDGGSAGPSAGRIPPEYLRASSAQRRELLAGLLGVARVTGPARITVPGEALAADVRELLHSLGFQSTVAAKPAAGHVIRFTDTLPWRYVVAVRPVPSVPVRCVQVDSKDHLYLAGRAMIPTHNSALALDFARSASIRHQLPSVMFSLEMGRNEITMRLLAAEARVPMHVMRTGQMSDDDWARLARRMSEVADAPLFIDDSPNMSLMEIRAKCRRLKQRHDLKLVIIDYLQLMSSPRRVENRQQEVSEMSRSLKLLAKELDVPVVALSQLNRGPEQRQDKKPMLSDLRESGCLTGDTRILRADTGAEVTFDQLMASGERDIPVWSVDERLKLVPRTLTHAFSSGVKEVFRVRLASGRELQATANHPFLTFRGWQSLGELTVGSRVAIPRTVPGPLHERSMPEHEIVMLAHLIGDGSFVKRQPIRYASVDEENLAAVTMAAAHFGITAVRDYHERARCTSLRLPAPFRLARGRRNPVAEWLDSLGLFGLRSHEKFVPESIFSLPKAQVALFFRHLWATDGSVTVSKSGNVRIYFGTTSERLARQLQTLLLRFGIVARLRAVGNTYGHPQWTIDVTGVEQQLKFVDDIGVHGSRASSVMEARARLHEMTAVGRFDTVPADVWVRVREVLAARAISLHRMQTKVGTSSRGDLNEKISPSRSRLGLIAKVLDDSELEMLATNDVFWDTVSSIESIGSRPVYDATVLGTHNFVANSTNIHNSIEQDADVVILLHREDAYERESPRAGEADLIVAKHRNGPTATVTVAFQGHYSRFVDMAPG
jgi:replicative DNA helicase